MKLWLVCGLALCGCRTEIIPVLRETKPQVSPARRGECEVRDFPMASDVPAGSQNLGWIKVPRDAGDEETFEKLRLAVCAKGGNAFSQAHWNRAAGASVADQPIELEANGWQTP